MHGFALSCIIRLYTLALVCNYHICIELFELFQYLWAPGRFIVDHGYLQCLKWEFQKIVDLLDSLLLLA